MAEVIIVERMEESYKIVNCPEFGDYAVSEQIFKEGETVFKEETLLSFPGEDQCITGEPEVCCVGCYKIIACNSKCCSKCDFPICSDVCSQNEFHKNLECGIFAENRIKPSQSTSGFLKYLRILLSGKVYPKRYEKFKLLSTELDSKVEHFTSIAEAESLAAWNFLTEECHLEVTLFEVRQVCIALKINSFDLYEEDNSGTRYRGDAVFTLCSKLSHSCSPNLQWFHSKTEAEDGALKWYLQVYAKRKIERGEVLSISYAARGLDYGTGFRREKYAHPFRCLCPRCLSPTELGTHFSSPKCPKCKWGYFLPEEPLSSLTCTWNCSHCTFSKDGVAIEKAIRKCETFVSRFVNQEPSSLEHLDKFIDKNSGTALHPNHFIIFQATIYWFLGSDWTAKLIKQDDDSVDLYEKILTRFYRCLPLVQKFRPTMKIVELEVKVAAAIASFAFKSEDYVTINYIYADRQLKFRFCKMIVSHLSRAHFWIQRQPCYRGCEENNSLLASHYDTWSRRLQIYEDDFLHYETLIQDLALISMRSIFR